jgi:hypothetical protein
MRMLIAATIVLATLSATAQQTAQPAAAMPPAGSNWQHVQALPVGMSLYVSAAKRHSSCIFKGADADSLTCTHGKDLVFQRAEVKTVKIAHRGRSMLIGAGAGMGAGALFGAVAYGGGCTGAQKRDYLGCFDGVSQSGFAVAGAAAFGVLGTTVGYFTDFTHSTVYKAP